MKLFRTSLFLIPLFFLIGVVHAAEKVGSNMMHNGGMMSGWIATLCALFGLLLFILSYSSLSLHSFKYLRSDKS